MGLLVDGIWDDQWYDTASTGGRFVRKDSAFRRWVTADGSGPDGFAESILSQHLVLRSGFHHKRVPVVARQEDLVLKSDRR